MYEIRIIYTRTNRMNLCICYLFPPHYIFWASFDENTNIIVSGTIKVFLQLSFRQCFELFVCKRPSNVFILFTGI